MLIREIILENFMSYEYSRIPLKSGVNLICGPNGAGKSSILLGISVALGQSYTERSKKLSDLIRWGKDIGRVTLVLDNSKRKDRRPIPKINKDQIFLTRVLRRDGKYWFELDNASVDRADVLRLLSRFQVDPDNMLIIMHQDMIEQFIVLSPQEKLKLIEEAVGLEPYRRNVLEARNKLSRILSQEESLGKMLESAEQTLNYWREQYDRFQQKKQLMLKRRFLERELAWAEVSARETAVLELEKEINYKKQSLEKIENTIKLSEEEIRKIQSGTKNLKDEWERIFEERFLLEKEKAQHEINILKDEENAKELRHWIELGQNGVQKILDNTVFLENFAGSNPNDLESRIKEIRSISEDLNMWFQNLGSRLRDLEESVDISSKKIADLDAKLVDVKNRMQNINREIDEFYNRIIDEKVNLAILEYQKKELTKEVSDLDSNLKVLRSNLDIAVTKAGEMGPRVASLRSMDMVLDEIRIIDGRVAALADVSEDIEQMYESYSKLYFELKEKARIAAENREKALEEIKTRTESWKTVIRDLLNHISLEYQRILSQAGATGTVRLINEQDIEAAGVEILVGFKGSQPAPLSIYSQSGGERSTATMSFLLALQQRIRSPFRAVDEYDVHMDPKNREVIANLLISAVSGGEAQYLAITPNQMLFEGKDVHIITVQNIEGISLVKEVT